MTPVQRKILSPVISQLVHRQCNAWSELKREVLDSGDQFEYQWEIDFFEPATKALKRLSDDDKDALIAEWNRTEEDGVTRSKEQIIELYAVPVMKEIVKRAKMAARRADSW